MRLPDELLFARLIRSAMLAGVAALATACAAPSADRSVPQALTTAVPAYGPQADYPVVVGDPYVIDGVTYKPVDTLNYDDVGYLAVETLETPGVTIAHHTLPVPSYVEITSLVTGRTILARVERRGPMDSGAIVALSPTALEQIEGSDGDPVRVRRVNPPETERVLLRSGQMAPVRMDTPASLVSVLKRRLPLRNVSDADQQPEISSPFGNSAIVAVDPGASIAETIARAEDAAAEDVLDPGYPALATELATSADPAEPNNEATASGFVVQAAAFSTRERAENAARQLERGFVLPAGEYWRLRTGPFSNRAEAEASLAKARAAGYTDARILTSG